MQIARVKGTVVSTNKAEKLMGLKLLVVKPIDLDAVSYTHLLFSVITNIFSDSSILVAGRSSGILIGMDKRPFHTEYSI